MAITEAMHSNCSVSPELINVINDEIFWKDIEDLLLVLDKLVTGISLFESDTPRLALFYSWYHEQLESNGKY